MNNDKRMILAIAVYAAVITMILHTISANAHQSVLAKVSKDAVEKGAVINPIVQVGALVSTNFAITRREDFQSGQACLLNDCVQTGVQSFEHLESKIEIPLRSVLKSIDRTYANEKQSEYTHSVAFVPKNGINTPLSSCHQSLICTGF